MCLAVPGRVESVDERDGHADGRGRLRRACARRSAWQYIPDVAVGEYVIVHVGFAIQRLDEESALETLANFEKLGILEEEFGDGFALAAAGRRGAAGTPREGATHEVPRRVQRPRPGPAGCSTRSTRRPPSRWAMMEVCGGQTHSIIRHGIDQLLPDGDRDDPRPGLPGLRDAAGDHRQGAGDRRAART